MRVEAVVSQQGHKVDDLVDVLVVVGFVGDKHPACDGETQMIEGRGGRGPEAPVVASLTLLQGERRAVRRRVVASE